MYTETTSTTAYYPSPKLVVCDLVPEPLHVPKVKALTQAQLDARDAAECARRNRLERGDAKPFTPRCR